MAVGNQLNYWDGSAWVKHVAPQGNQGPAGPTGAAAPARASAGGMGFQGSIGGYVSGSSWTNVRNINLTAGFTDRNPCLKIKDTQTLQVARAGTILLHAQAWIDGAPTTQAGQSSVLQINSPHIGRSGFSMFPEQRNSLAVVIPNAAVNFEINFWFLAVTTVGTVNIWATMFAALLP